MDLQKIVGSYEKPVRDQYVGKFSPYIINGIGESTLDKLHLEGVLSVEKLATCDAKEISLNTGVPERVINFLKLKAISTLENEIYKINIFEFPVDDVIYFDIENNYKDGLVWLIGCLKEDEFVQFYADHWDEEKKILEEFREYLVECEGYTLVSYSGTDHDLRLINKGYKRNGIDYSVGLEHLDILKPVRNCFVFPLTHYGLKAVGSLLGYKFDNIDVTGVGALSAYEEHIWNRTPIDPKVFKYNEDDVKAVKHVNEALQEY
jgi:predicted RecB family nuclease